MIFFKVNQNLYYRTEIDYIYFALPEIYLSNSLLSLDIKVTAGNYKSTSG